MAPAPENAPCWHHSERPREICSLLLPRAVVPRQHEEALHVCCYLFSVDALQRKQSAGTYAQAVASASDCPSFVFQECILEGTHRDQSICPPMMQNDL